MPPGELKNQSQLGLSMSMLQHTSGKLCAFPLGLVHKRNSLILEQAVDLSFKLLVLWAGLGRACPTHLRPGPTASSFNGRGLSRGGRHSTGDEGPPGTVSET